MMWVTASQSPVVAALYVDPNLRERFFAKTLRDEETGCLVWTASKNRKGYGQIHIVALGRPVLSHRLAWYLEHGQWPDPCALHRCDTAACVEVSHLFEGTRGDNNRDMWAKGRGRSAGAAKTECVNGHPLSGDNIRFQSGRRICRACKREWIRAKRATQ